MPRRAALTVAALLVGVLAGCGGSSGGDDGGTGKTDTITISVANGKVDPPTHRQQVAQGDTVKLVVTSDEADEVHVHGVDLEEELTPGKPTTITFVAKDPGIYEVETHESGLQLVQIEVR